MSDGRYKVLAFDMGGVIFKIDKNRAVRAFQEVGFTDAPRYLNAFTQIGIFGELESGRISAEEFRNRLSALSTRELTLEDCRHGWMGYFVELPRRNLAALERLRTAGYRLCLLSNTNPFMMSWARSIEFDGVHPTGIAHYFDALYLSYELGVMKPEPRIFELMMEREQVAPHEVLFIDDSPHNVEAAAKLGIDTLQPGNGDDWREALKARLTCRQ